MKQKDHSGRRSRKDSERTFRRQESALSEVGKHLPGSHSYRCEQWLGRSEGEQNYRIGRDKRGEAGIRKRHDVTMFGVRVGTKAS